ncbi:LytR/AlgR family response regulator transcription factor [Fluviicola taffensis]|uniref:Two component transcriptional regulator, LytTR family n=1 Tax=Fluviicola taffensis (strain DSM 16823 / NCIMB 13979 / RW262) TaxID=755732 RepID=F2IJH7_FLUTR|nr:LytTR family DNA-binding domain-containing protein [Fluviicola taffensis]AEA42865.1 two component transcriptional regulator, LytTR family [Fluviicola taffensis DSM 16823]
MDKPLLRVVLLDDELLALSYLRTLCEGISDIEVVKAFDNPLVFLSEVPNLSFDFCISDIVMPNLSGLQVAEKLDSKPIIFTTAHNEYAADAFDIEAIDYLRKPVQRERLERAIEKVRIRIEQSKNQATWTVNTNKGKFTIQLSAIVRFSTDTYDRRDKLLLLEKGDELVVKNKSFDQLLQELDSISFIRISKSELVSKEFIQGYQGDVVLSKIRMKDGKYIEFSLSENYRKTFLEAFNQ